MFGNIFQNGDKNKSLNSLFYPKSIAVIGASNNTEKIGGFIFSQLKDLPKVKTFPVNVKFKKIQKTEAYTNVLDIKSKIDLAVIAIPRYFVLESLRDCIKAGIKNVIIISAGFKETGSEGLEKEQEIKDLIEDSGINLVGPNCLGVLNAEKNMNCSFAMECPKPGDVALISQSGAVIDAIIDWSIEANVGFSKIISLGNMAGINSNDALNYFKDDPKTSAIVFYMETIENGGAFAEILKETSKKKPVIIIKPGNSSEAKKAIGSHTGSLAQDNTLVKTLIEENNGIFVEDLTSLYNILKGLKANLPTGKNTIMITNAGGVGVITTDNLSKYGFELYKFSDEEKEKFEFLPKAASLNNPIDILGDAKSDRYEKTLEIANEIESVDNIIILLTPQIMTDTINVAKAIEKVSQKTKKTIYACFLGGKQIKEGLSYLSENRLPYFNTPKDAISTLNYLYKYKNFEYREKEKGYTFDEKKIEDIRLKLENSKGLLSYNLTKEIINFFKINMPDKIILNDIDEVLQTELEDEKKYVLKVDSGEIIHKKDVGGIEKGVTNKDFKDKAIEMFERISKVTDNFTINIEEEVSGHEVIVGLKQEEGLSNFIMFGMGGSYVELYEDANFTTCPLSKNQVEDFIKKSKAYKILNGYRGGDKINFTHLEEILVRLSYLQIIFPEIKEADFNPIMCSSKGIYLVDVKLIV